MEIGMHKPKRSSIQKQYKFDEKNNMYLIEVSLDDYDDVYDEWDPAPFKKRFIQEEFDDFIIESADDIPAKYKLGIVLYIPMQKKDIEKEKAVVAAYRNYYSYVVEKAEVKQFKLRKKSIKYLMLALLFLGTGYFLQSAYENVILNVLEEGVFIGGWVFLWEFFTDIFMTRRELKLKYNLKKRLYETEIRFQYL